MILLIPILIINRNFYIDAYKKIIKGAVNMNTLISVGSIAAMLYGIYTIIMCLIKDYDHSNHIDLYFESAGTILTLVSLGKYIEYKSKSKTTKALDELLNLVPKKAIRLKEENNRLDIAFAHPGVTASTLFEGLHTNLFWKIALPIMRHIFMSNDKASLPILYAINHNHDNRHWIGPKGLFQVWGYPAIKKVKKDLFDIEEIKIIKEKVNEIEG
jgi:hypothetical protein